MTAPEYYGRAQLRQLYEIWELLRSHSHWDFYHVEAKIAIQYGFRNVTLRKYLRLLEEVGAIKINEQQNSLEVRPLPPIRDRIHRFGMRSEEG